MCSPRSSVRSVAAPWKSPRSATCGAKGWPWSATWLHEAYWSRSIEFTSRRAARRFDGRHHGFSADRAWLRLALSWPAPSSEHGLISAQQLCGRRAQVFERHLHAVLVGAEGEHADAADEAVGEVGAGEQDALPRSNLG